MRFGAMTVLKNKRFSPSITTETFQRLAEGRNVEKNQHVAQQNLQRELREQVNKIRLNETKHRRFQALELAIIECTRLTELLDLVLDDYRKTSHVETVNLYLYDPDFELRRFLADEGDYLATRENLFFTEELTLLQTVFSDPPEPRLGFYQSASMRELFARSFTPSSVALLPLVRNQELIGSLNLGSENVQRYSQKSASDFLQRFSTIVAICLRNVINSERLKQVGLTDGLTGVHNRRYFDQRLEEEVTLMQRNPRALSSIFFDIDFFKRINDQHGHLSGDAVLRDVAAILRHHLRNHDVLARYGGEEFSALLINTPAEEAAEIAERIRAQIADTAFKLPNNATLKVTISAGVAELRPETARQIDPSSWGSDLLKRADACLYEAKNNGRDRVVAETATKVDTPISN